MKKLLAILTALSIALAFSACGKKDKADQPADKKTSSSTEETTTEPTSENLSGVTNTNSQEAWESKYPGINVCPFSIHYAEYETGEYEEQYYFANGGDLRDWVNTPFNIGGWFVYEDMVVSADGNYAVKEFESMSSFCTFEAVKLDNPIQKPAEKQGTVHVLNYSNDFTVYGLILAGNRQDYGENWSLDSAEYSLRDLNKDFYLNEHISVYVNGRYYDEVKNKATVYCIPHTTESELASMTAVQLAEKEAFAGVEGTAYTLETLDENKESAAVEDYIHPEKFQPGLYDIVIASGDTVCYYVTVNLTTEPQS